MRQMLRIWRPLPVGARHQPPSAKLPPSVGFTPKSTSRSARELSLFLSGAGGFYSHRSPLKIRISASAFPSASCTGW